MGLRMPGGPARSTPCARPPTASSMVPSSSMSGWVPTSPRTTAGRVWTSSASASGSVTDRCHRSWLRSGESYAGVAPGWAGSDQTAVPLDWGRLEHQGPVRWYGAMVIGGTGGCTLDVEGGVGVDGKPPQASVLEPDQRIVCLLPVDAVPDGRCPGENLP